MLEKPSHASSHKKASLIAFLMDCVQLYNSQHELLFLMETVVIKSWKTYFKMKDLLMFDIWQSTR